ncbi:MAG: antibiotic biosynthesis monooxygenase [Pseudomonadota bacterium]
MFIAMNRFRVTAGREADFEAVWKNRDTHLDGVPGFVAFRLLKGAAGDGFTLYASHTVWADEAAFRAWTTSEAFRAAHKDAGANKDLYLEAPVFEGFEAVEGA